MTIKKKKKTIMTNKKRVSVVTRSKELSQSCREILINFQKIFRKLKQGNLLLSIELPVSISIFWVFWVSGLIIF